MQSKEKNNISFLIQFFIRAFLIAVLCFVLSFAVIITIYLGDLVFKVNTKKNLTPLFGTYVIVSPSMVPTINVEDAIVTKRVDNDKYKIGDIITFDSPDVNYENLIITHRVVNKKAFSIEQSLYTTKGDNNETIDPISVLTSAIYGRVLFKIPKVGYLKNFFSKPTNFFISLLIPTLILVFYDIFRIFIMMNKRRSYMG